jgi:hypothetical protein
LNLPPHGVLATHNTCHPPLALERLHYDLQTRQVAGDPKKHDSASPRLLPGKNPAAGRALSPLLSWSALQVCRLVSRRRHMISPIPASLPFEPLLRPLCLLLRQTSGRSVPPPFGAQVEVGSFLAPSAVLNGLPPAAIFHTGSRQPFLWNGEERPPRIIRASFRPRCPAQRPSSPMLARFARTSWGLQHGAAFSWSKHSCRKEEPRRAHDRSDHVREPCCFGSVLDLTFVAISIFFRAAGLMP